jgi:3-oxoacid CoA-transferase A subunit
MNKVWASAEEAIADIEDGASIAVGGFFTAGVPRVLLKAMADKGVRDLSLACGCGPLLGVPEVTAQLVKNKQIMRIIDSYGLYRSASKGKQDPLEQAVRAGEIELRIYPMGTIAERLRAAGAGIPAFYTPTGVGTIVEDATVTNVKEEQSLKETRIFNGERYVLERALTADFAFVHAYAGDREGNLRYRMTSRNFNPVMAAACKVTIAEVENLVEPGELDPDCVHTPGIYVQRVVQVPRPSFAVTID